MTEHMRNKRPMIGLPVILIVSIIVGALLSNSVLSLSPLAGFAVIFGASAIIIAAVEIRVYLRRKPRRPHFASLSAEERKRRARRARKSSKGKSPGERGELIDREELLTPVDSS